MDDRGTDLQIALDLPADWHELDLDPATSEASIEAFCAELMPGEELSAWRREMEANLRLVAAQGRAAGVVAVDFFADLIDEEPWLITASASVSMIPTGPEVVGISEIERELARQGGQIEPVDLPAGPALRAVTLRSEMLPEADEPVDVLHIRFFVPLPEQGEIALLAFSTPTIALRSEMSELFEAIAESLVLTPIEDTEQAD